VRYRTLGPGTEVLKTAFPVQQVVTTEAGSTGKARETVEADWEYNPETGLLQVRHTLPLVEVVLAE
jgi:hypothetical protein